MFFKGDGLVLRWINILVVVLMLLAPLSAFSYSREKRATTKPDTTTTETVELHLLPPGSEPQEIDISEEDLRGVPPILDPGYRHRKNNQFEFYPYIGAYVGATVDQTFAVGARLLYHFNNTWAIGANYSYSKLLTDRSSTFGQSITDTNMHIANAEVVISNDAALRVGKKVVELDFFMTLGAGSIKLNETWEPAGLIGGGVKVYPGKSWVVFRVDVNNYLHMTAKPGHDPFDFDVEFIGGVSFLFPTNPSPYEKPKIE